MKNVILTVMQERRVKEMNTMSPIRKDFLASNLRSQLGRLSRILSNIEEERLVDGGCASDSLKEVELNLRQIRKLCMDN